MTDRRARIERLLSGVLRQAFRDAGTGQFLVEGDNRRDVAFVTSLCESAGATPGEGLKLHPASKTALLLGEVPIADVLPLGDLYHSEIVSLIGPVGLSGPAAELASACGGPDTLDRVLRRHFDERLSWERAAAELSGTAGRILRDRLDAARFRRSRVGLVPKVGSRTLGIDLYA